MADADIHARIAPYLKPGERVLWAGKPARAPLNGMGLMFVVMGGLFFLIGLGITLASLVTLSPVALFGMLFAAAGGWNFYCGLRFTAAPARQLYALTDQRALIVETFLGTRVGTLSPAKLCAFATERKGDIGTVRFEPETSVFAMGPRVSVPLNAFLNIDAVDRVEDLITRTHCARSAP